MSEFSKNLELSAQNAKFSNNTLKIIEELNNGVKQASEDISKKASDLKHATTPLKEFGKNYPEFALKPKEALEKLLQEKNGQVAGAAFREDLGGIDLVWGTPKTKDSNGYGLAHILEKREKQYKRLGLTNEQAKERTKELLKQIPEVIEKGIKDNDYIGHATIRHNGIEVGLSSQKGNTPLKNHYMITSFETDEKVLRELKTIGTLSNNYRDGINYSTSNLNNPNPTTNALKTQEPLSEQANAKKLLKLESEKGIKEASKKSAEESEIKERAFKVIEDKEAFLKDLNAIKPTPLPKEIDTDSFLNAFNGVSNKENFIKHLQSKPDSKHRLAYLNLVEPTLKEPDITLIFKEQGKEVKKEHIKAFQGDPKTIYYFLVTQDNDNKLITGLRTSENYLKAEIDKADIIHSFIPQDS
ncbi:DUF3519 domain-containing protein [Helicobacter pylori]